MSSRTEEPSELETDLVVAQHAHMVRVSERCPERRT
jgi:hypothetical protein